MRYVALLRAINVGGRTVPMAKLKELFEGFGFTEVSTYIQTGNVTFSSNEKNQSKVAKVIEEGLKKALNFNHVAFVLTREELAEAAKQNPLKPLENPQKQTHLVFLSEKPRQEKVKTLMGMAEPEYTFAVKGNVLYYSYGREWAGKRRQVDFEKILGVTGTARTWKVVDKLIELVGQDG